MKRSRYKYVPLAVVVTAIALVQTLLFAFALRGAKTASDTSAPVSAQAPSEDDTTERDQLTERDQFIQEWAGRIDAYNAGYPLEGYGATFAAAAYDYAADPRLSPAIARVESGSGTSCLYSCNAWGWGTHGWSDWETAIYAHVSGMASSYGTEFSWNMAQALCPENTDEWYAQVSSCLEQI